MKQYKKYRFTVQRHYIADLGVGYQLSGPETVADFLKAINLHTESQENFLAIFLDTRNQVSGYQVISTGLLDRSHVHPREVFRAAILNNTSKIVLAHNHPSGNCSPSPQDCSSTKNLVEAGEILGIKVIDHLIVAESKGQFTFHSMRERGDM